MSKFKVGDKVEIVRKDETGCMWNSAGFMDGTIGQTGIVHNIHLPDKTHTLRFGIELASGRYWLYNENCLELVQEETMNTLTHKELLQALLDGGTLISEDSCEMYLEPDGFVTTLNSMGGLQAKTMFGIFLTSDSSRNAWTIKPKVILINGIEVPEPCRKEIPLNTEYYVPDITSKQLYTVNTRTEWLDTAMRIDKGIVHLTKEAAIQHAKALLSFTSQEEI